MDAAVSSEHARRSETWAELKLAGERADRMDRAADSLRNEISRKEQPNVPQRRAIAGEDSRRQAGARVAARDA